MTIPEDRANSEISPEIFELAARIPDNIELVVKDKREVIELIVMALFAQGHVLCDDVPGTAKTITARALGASVDAEMIRVQFTPDLQPFDLTGGPIYNEKTKEFVDRVGPVRRAKILLGDEINRAMAKSQSALLEVMGEGQVTTADGVTHKAPEPFFVIATQNPIDQEGTNPLPEAQMDRFMVRVTFGHPGPEALAEIIRAQRGGHPIKNLRPVVTTDELLQIQQAVRQVTVKSSINTWITNIVARTQALEYPLSGDKEALLKAGSSARGGIALDRLARARAILEGRDFVTPEDVAAIVVPVLGHRLIKTRHRFWKEAETKTHDEEGALRAFFQEHVFKHVPYDDDAE